MSVDVVFTFARPKSHYGTGRNADVGKVGAGASQRVDIGLAAILDGRNGGVVATTRRCRLADRKLWGRDDSTHLLLRGLDG